jgi:hypothetical protein
MVCPSAIGKAFGLAAATRRKSRSKAHQKKRRLLLPLNAS